MYIATAIAAGLVAIVGSYGLAGLAKAMLSGSRPKEPALGAGVLGVAIKNVAFLGVGVAGLLWSIDKMAAPTAAPSAVAGDLQEKMIDANKATLEKLHVPTPKVSFEASANLYGTGSGEASPKGQPEPTDPLQRALRGLPQIPDAAPLEGAATKAAGELAPPAGGAFQAVPLGELTMGYFQDWRYFTTYSENASEALAQLQEDVIKKGTFRRRFANHAEAVMEAERNLALEKQRSGENPKPAGNNIAGYEARLAELKRLAEPGTIADKLALVRLMNQGLLTDSILDVNGVSALPAPFKVCPVSSDELIKLLGTNRPTKELVEASRDKLPRVDPLPEEAMKTFYGGHTSRGYYFTVYQDGKPDSYFFYGASNHIEVAH
jgi:hypothetical protein